MNKELKKCPFCGVKSQIHLLTIEYNGWYFIQCQVCGSQCGSQTTEEDAIIAWNRRASADNGGEGVFTLDEYIEMAKQELDVFRDEWIRNSEIDLEEWPLELSGGHWREEERDSRFV